jgi:hypothetical protein
VLLRKEIGQLENIRSGITAIGEKRSDTPRTGGFVASTRPVCQSRESTVTNFPSLLHDGFYSLISRKSRYKKRHTRKDCLDVIHFLTKIRKEGGTEDSVHVIVNDKQGGDK